MRGKRREKLRVSVGLIGMEERTVALSGADWEVAGKEAL